MFKITLIVFQLLVIAVFHRWKCVFGFAGLRLFASSQKTNAASILYAATDGSKEGRKPTPAQRAIQQSARQDFDNFDKLKQAIYGAVDGIQNSGDNDKPESKARVVDGYSEKQRRATPVEQVMRGRNEPTQSRTSSNMFNSLKDAVYGTADLASSLSGKIVAGASDRQQSSLTKEKIPAKRTISQEIIDSIPDLKSDNPFKRLAAEAKLKNFELEAEARKKKKEVEDSINKIKQTVYDTGDALNGAIETVKTVPSVVNEAVSVVNDAVENVKTIPSQVSQRAQEVNQAVQMTVDDITAIPTKVEAKINEVQKSVDETVSSTIQFIEDIKAIPSKIEQTVENTKKAIDTTVQTVEEVKTNTKILLGLEKPKPKPPKTPPKQKTASDYAFQAMGTVASATGKAAFWVGKGAVDLTVKAALTGFEAAKDSISKREQETSSITKSTSKKVAEVTQKTDSLLTDSNDDKAGEVITPLQSTDLKPEVVDSKELEKDIQEALKLASDALQTSPPVADSMVDDGVEKSSASTKPTKKSKTAGKKKSGSKKKPPASFE